MNALPDDYDEELAGWSMDASYRPANFKIIIEATEQGEGSLLTLNAFGEMLEFHNMISDMQR